MYRYFLSIVIILLTGSAYSQTSIYSIQIDSASGTTPISLSSFTGKMILIVNTASLDSNASQFNELIQFYSMHKDSVVVLAVPSNSFGSEPGTAAGAFYAQTGIFRFPVTGNANITGAAIHPLYAWLTQQSLNGSSSSAVTAPYCKYLINRQGKLVGIVSSKVRPMSPALRQILAKAER